jgi:diacylglycerol kinase (ATP)
VSRLPVVLITNPAAGTHTAGRLTAQVLAELSRHLDVTAVLGSDAAESRALVGQHAAHSAAVFVLGGDGIVHQAIQHLALTDVPIGIIAAGTGNDTAASLAIPTDPIAAAAALSASLRAGRVRHIDLGRATCSDLTTWWVTVLCAGFDSAVNERANAMRWPRGPRRYDLAILAEALTLHPRHYRLEIDGVSEELDATMVSVCNGPRYGGGKLLAPFARLDDGRFTVVVVAPLTRHALVALAPKLNTGSHVGHPAVTFRRAGQVTIAAERVAYADGERIAPLPITTQCVPQALAVLTPTVAGPSQPG